MNRTSGLASTNMERQNSRPTLGGHEKFVFRHGWLKKGIDAISDDPGIFSSDNALIVLGVGKNMVRSIRHWCLATGLVEEIQESGQGRTLRVSGLGERLFRPTAWDAYLEDVGTLWLLHWLLAANRHRAIIWHFVFSRLHASEFTKQQLCAFVARQIDYSGLNTTIGAIEREIDCFLRTYVPAIRNRNSPFSEENLACPLVELDMIRYSQDDNLYSFNAGRKATLPVEIFGYGLVHFLDNVARHRRTLHIDECIYQEGSPGQVFRLDANSVVEYIESLEKITEGAIRLQESIGLSQIYLHDMDSELWKNMPYHLLSLYYEHR